jgi:hypothetical protein
MSEGVTFFKGDDIDLIGKYTTGESRIPAEPSGGGAASDCTWAKIGDGTPTKVFGDATRVGWNEKLPGVGRAVSSQRGVLEGPDTLDSTN